MNIALMLTGIGAIEYNFTYHPFVFPPWHLTVWTAQGTVESSAPTIEGVIEDARRQINMSREDYVNRIQDVLDRYHPNLVAVFRHDSNGVALVSIEDEASESILVDIEMDETTVDEAVQIANETGVQYQHAIAQV